MDGREPTMDLRSSAPRLLLAGSLALAVQGCAAADRNAGEQSVAGDLAERPPATEPAPAVPELPPAEDRWLPPPASELFAAELTTVGWDAVTGSPVVLLRTLDAGQVVPIWIGIAEAQAIARALHGVVMPRPMTHDLMANLLSNLHAGLEELLITELRDGVYYGRLKLRVDGENEARWIDTRPSDGLALALRTGATIRLARSLLDDLPDYDFLAPDAPDQVVRTLGLTVVSPSEELRRTYELGDRQGIVVIAASGQAKAQGLRRGDLIVAIDGQPVSAPIDLLDRLRQRPESITLTYYRQGKTHDVVLYPLEDDDDESVVA
ncbi:MAG: PDZ domain-containing protein [Acidobacteria bacterium]|nr:MAG: PDZ domain-containing protein [Acidobacteriota bacterium]